MLRRMCLAFVPCAALWGQLGCALTQATWEGAERDNRAYIGVVRSVDAATGNARLIAHYGGWAISDAFVSISLDSTGAPPAALTYGGKAKVGGEISADLGPAQSDAVARFALAPATARDAGNADTSGQVECFVADGRIVAVALGRDGTPLTDYPQAVPNDAVRFPNDCRIILLPASIPRSVAERRESAAAATLLTPATATVDAALIPVGVAYRLLNGR